MSGNTDFFPLERNRYFYGKLLTVRDFEIEQKYTRSSSQLMNRLALGAGVVCGLGVGISDDSTLLIESGMAIDYLGRYSHRIAISNARIEDVSETSVTFRAKDYRTGGVKHITITHEEFIRRFLQHVLPAGFQKIRYYGILTNSLKKKRLEIIFRIQNHRRFRSKYSGMETDVKLFEMFGIDIHICPCCGERSLRQCYRTYGRTPSGVG